MIRVVCPNCSSQFDTQDMYAGRTANCPQCGTQLTIPQAPTASSGFSPGGGPPPMPGYAPQTPSSAGATYYPPNKQPGVALAGMICGIVGFVLSLISAIPCIGCFTLLLAGPTALAGVICSVIGLILSKKRGQKMTYSIVGLSLSILAIIWAPIVYFLILGALGAGGAFMDPSMF